MNIKLNNFSGGLNITTVPENIPEPTIEICENWEYGTLLNQNDVKKHNCCSDFEGNIEYDDTGNRWYINNNSWSPTVLYCPFCGEKLPIK